MPARVRAPPTPGSWSCCKDCTLPLRTTIDRLHRDLLLGEPGRLYSELAASWLGVMAVSGIVLMVLHRRRVGRGRCARVTLVPCPGEANTYRRTRSCHTATGVWLALDFLFLASSGLTWSAHAGENVSQLRSALHWTAPKVSTALPGSAQRQGAGDEHAEHHGHQAHTGHSSPGSFDAVLTSARTARLDSQLVEIRPAKSRDAAWTAAENDRPWASWVWWWAATSCGGAAVPRAPRARVSAPYPHGGALLLVVGLGVGLFVPLLGISLVALLAADLAVAVVPQRRSARESAH
ncbi:PepSY-associated TM helix domain-containing protein [Kocuria marina]|uniref:PepSY-associated TM helix domain-containing protein n=1 Tax=Kocuria marina TaxID=223184 RepID=UPI00345FD249